MIESLKIKIWMKTPSLLSYIAFWMRRLLWNLKLKKDFFWKNINQSIWRMCEIFKANSHYLIRPKLNQTSSSRTKFLSLLKNLTVFFRLWFCTLSDKTMSDKIFVGQNFSSDKIFVTSEKFRHFCPTKYFVLFKFSS